MELDEWPRVLPIPETDAIVVWTSAEVEDNTQDLEE